MKPITLIQWRSLNNESEVLESTWALLKKENGLPDQLIYLHNGSGKPKSLLPEIGNKFVERYIPLKGVTDHKEIYVKLKKHLEKIVFNSREIWVNISPGTPAMHAVWLILNAEGLLGNNVRMFATQRIKDEKSRGRIDEVDLGATNYLKAIKKVTRQNPSQAQYDPVKSTSILRREAMEKLWRYARVQNAPLLVLGERGLGKTRWIENSLSTLKGCSKVITVPCGSLGSNFAESTIFGHKKGAFTGALEKRDGLVKKAEKQILFFDEVQDLPATVQRMLVRLLQEKKYRPLGMDREEDADVNVVCASHLGIQSLRKRLDADLFDRLSMLMVNIPPLRDCREDLKHDWNKVWEELRTDKEIPIEAPWSETLAKVLTKRPLWGNFRDIQSLVYRVIAFEGWKSDADLNQAINDWEQVTSIDQGSFDLSGYHETMKGTFQERSQQFKVSLVDWSIKKIGSVKGAAKYLDTSAKTLHEYKKLVLSI